MISIKVTIPLSFWAWSDSKRMPLKNIPLSLSSKLNAKITYNGNHEIINEKNLPEYKSYTDIKTVTYIIKSTKNGRYKKSTPEEILYKKIHDDVLRVHNRHIGILRSKLKAWQFEELKPGTNIPRDLEGWKTEYRFGVTGRFKMVKGVLPMSLIDILSLRPNFTVHIDRNDMDDISEWLEDGAKDIQVLDELLAQAKAFEIGDNLRLSILNYTAALELAIRQYFHKKLPQRINPSPDMGTINSFLTSTSTTLEQKIRIILPLVIDKSWFKDIDLNLINDVIKARNKIAHDGLIDVTSKFPDVDWKKALVSTNLLIDTLQTLEYLLDSSPEIRHIKDGFYKKFSQIPNVWLYSKYHKTALEVVFYSGDSRSDETLREMIKETSSIRIAQVARFKPSKHLTISFFKYPRERFATYRNGKLIYLPKK